MVTLIKEREDGRITGLEKKVVKLHRNRDGRERDTPKKGWGGVLVCTGARARVASDAGENQPRLAVPKKRGKRTPKINVRHDQDKTGNLHMDGSQLCLSHAAKTITKQQY